MSERVVRKWVRMFNGSRKNVHDENQSGRPSLVTDDLVRAVDEKIQQISHTPLYKTVTNCLGYHNLCSRWVPKMLTDMQKTKRLGSALTYSHTTVMMVRIFKTKL
ncbi:hypothetical protein J6590_069118 [Homalodisca vitripennis]|nr:hypothetical protein J6590_069118 [Homalodisca vitripennis]